MRPDESLVVNPDFVYNQYDQPVVPDPNIIITTGGTAVTTINSASGPIITITGGSTGLTFSSGSATISMAGTLVVANGGTGRATNTAFAVMAGGTTATGALQQVSGLGAAGQVLTSTGAGALPAWGASKSMLGAQFGTGVAASVPASTTVFATLYAGGTTGLSSTEANKQIPMAYAGTIRNFRVLTTSAQGAGGSLVFTVRKNGADTTVIATVTAGAAAGTFVDTTHSVDFAAGDLFSISALNNDAGAPSCTFTSLSLEYDSL